MSADNVVERVATAIRRAYAKDITPGAIFAPLAQAAIDAHIAYLCEQAGVSDEQIVAAVMPQPHAGSASKVRDMIAQSVARLVDENERLTEGVVHWERAELERTHERDALAAQVEALTAENERLRGAVDRDDRLDLPAMRALADAAWTEETISAAEQYSRFQRCAEVVPALIAENERLVLDLEAESERTE